jgi:pseudaminic acid cytidylyltransferase
LFLLKKEMFKNSWNTHSEGRVKSLAVIPARGGSKRIRGKNIRVFAGKPIIAYSIASALESGVFDEVMVSTDVEEVSNISIEWGAKVPFLRSQENAGDMSTLTDVVLEVVHRYASEGITFDAVCCILPTAPFIQPGDLVRGFEMLGTGSWDSVIPVVRFGYPIQRALRFVDQKVEMFHPEHMFTRSQDLEPAFHDAGQFYWLRADVFCQERTIFLPMTGGIEVPESRVQDIDNEEDWRLAEIKFASLR